MKKFGARTLGIGASGIVAVALFLSAAAAPPRVQTIAAPTSEIVLSLDPAQSKANFSVDTTLHTVHGTFNIKSGIVRFDPETGKASGAIIVFATSGESGNGSRDARMHTEILETTKYPDVVFRPAQVEGKVAPSGASDVKLHGTFSIHGTDHDLTAPVHAEMAGDHWNGTSNFEVPYVTWGIKDPSNFLLKVKHVVHVEMEMSGETKIAGQNP
jgi:polyisoprenoid-binding protein YceI